MASDKPRPKVDPYGSPWCGRECSLYQKAEGVMLDKCAYPGQTFASFGGLCLPAVREMARDLRESKAIIRALTRALTLAVGEERAAAELEKVYRQL